MVTVVEQTSDFVAMGDAQKRPFYFNKAARKMLGYGENEDMSRVRIEDTHPTWAMKIVSEQGIPTAIREGRWSGETAFLGRDGKEIPVSQLIMAHKRLDGSISFFSTVARDITERKRWEDELKAKGLELETKVKEMEQLNKILMGREERILELKQEIENLRRQLT
jgi:PAS domain S-box-containing protein